MIKIEELYIKRTPKELSDYLDKSYNLIGSSKTETKLSRIIKGPYKPFFEELLPLSRFCNWKYKDREDVMCSLMPGSEGRDALIHFTSTGIEHSLEITWPIDGKKKSTDAKMVNMRGYSDTLIYNTEYLNQIIDRTIEGAKKKSLKDYHFSGGSSLVILIDTQLFDMKNTEHLEVIDKLIFQLKDIAYQVDDVYLNLFPNKDFITIKST